jgi:hypothetical protein
LRFLFFCCWRDGAAIGGEQSVDRALSETGNGKTR